MSDDEKQRPTFEAAELLDGDVPEPIVPLAFTPLRFPLGQLVATPAALEAVSPQRVQACLRRHVRGDWGDVHPEDRGANDAALRHGDRLLSVYPVDPDVVGGPVFWIITEADRSSTTVLLPDDY